MQEKTKRGSAAHEQPAFAVLIILVAVATIILIYCLQFSVFIPTSRSRLEKKGPMPWDEQARLWDTNLPPPMLHLPPGKPAITHELELTGSVDLADTVKSKDSRRGQIILWIDPSGIVQGIWSCQYSHSDVFYDITADFTGNVDLDKTYVDSKGAKDPSKLYLITRGSYSKLAKNLITGEKQSDTGLVYVTGYINKDCTADGYITITDDEKSWYAQYQWFTE
ncbi:MAG: hypothetical protein ABIG61_13125 [Planctomycetota bacterium]